MNEKINNLENSNIPDGDIPSLEVISADINGVVDPISMEYNSYRNDLNKIYLATSENNSIVSKFVVNDKICNHEIVIKYSNGTVSKEMMKQFNFDQNFIDNFLFPMIEDYNKYNKIYDDNVIINSDTTAKFSIHTKSNDSLEINNISVDLASKLSDIVLLSDTDNPNLTDGKTVKKLFNEKGMGNIFVIILAIILIAIIIIGTVFFTIMSN